MVKFDQRFKSHFANKSSDRRIAQRNFGDVKPVGSGISEMRIHCGAGYRVYFINRNNEIVILLGGGDKDSQQSDIKIAKELALEVKEVQYES